MDEEQRMLWMANEVYGPAGTSCYFETHYSDSYDQPLVLALMKDSSTCWTKSKVDLVFDYLTKDL